MLVAVTGHFRPTFLRPANLMNIAQAQSAVGIVAVGMTLVIVAGGIDLSVGSLLALAGGSASCCWTSCSPGTGPTGWR